MSKEPTDDKGFVEERSASEGSPNKWARALARSLEFRGQGTKEYREGQPVPGAIDGMLPGWKEWNCLREERMGGTASVYHQYEP